VTFTFGGLQINTQAQVLNTSNNPIRGLFASGDIVGLFFHNYPSCTGQTRNVVFSRLLAETRRAGAVSCKQRLIECKCPANYRDRAVLNIKRWIQLF